MREIKRYSNSLRRHYPNQVIGYNLSLCAKSVDIDSATGHPCFYVVFMIAPFFCVVNSKAIFVLYTANKCLQ